MRRKNKGCAELLLWKQLRICWRAALPVDAVANSAAVALRLKPRRIVLSHLQMYLLKQSQLNHHVLITVVMGPLGRLIPAPVAFGCTRDSSGKSKCQLHRVKTKDQLQWMCRTARL